MKEEQERQSEMDNFNIFLKIVIQYKNTNTRYTTKEKIRSWRLIKQKRTKSAWKGIQEKNNKKSHDSQIKCLYVYFVYV